MSFLPSQERRRGSRARSARGNWRPMSSTPRPRLQARNRLPRALSQRQRRRRWPLYPPLAWRMTVAWALWPVREHDRRALPLPAGMLVTTHATVATHADMEYSLPSYR